MCTAGADSSRKKETKHHFDEASPRWGLKTALHAQIYVARYQGLEGMIELVVSQNGGNPILKYYNPHYRDPQKRTPNLEKTPVLGGLRAIFDSDAHIPLATIASSTGTEAAGLGKSTIATALRGHRP